MASDDRPLSRAVGPRHLAGFDPKNPSARPSPRAFSIALGLWLFISAFIWPHNAASLTNTWLLGLVIVAIGIVALYVPWFRWLNTAAAIWLFISTLLIPHMTRGTLWNNVIVAVLVFLSSLAPGGLYPPRRHGRRAVTV